MTQHVRILPFGMRQGKGDKRRSTEAHKRTLFARPDKTLELAEHWVCLFSMLAQNLEEYHQNAERCEAQAERLERAGNTQLAKLYTSLAVQWRSLAEQVQQSRF